ncbi:hypothetical protein PGTUg99_020932 [Puccinia graminis f. sp. tritici]|uniref:Uncharacterized protein n=1 Tax=Puccinia graminis f. sp. tritici TaxID=56615 RepID=A0A5B0QLK2_PUCGR|nr:hypothetical protein PGTUg99_020932 [Puccinia graminis f. sp. tritici]
MNTHGWSPSNIDVLTLAEAESSRQHSGDKNSNNKYFSRAGLPTHGLPSFPQIMLPLAAEEPFPMSMTEFLHAQESLLGMPSSCSAGKYDDLAEAQGPCCGRILLGGPSRDYHRASLANYFVKLLPDPARLLLFMWALIREHDWLGELACRVFMKYAKSVDVCGHPGRGSGVSTLESKVK